MIRFQWNALRAGDHVRVDVDGADLEDGTVVLVDSLPGSNGVGIRMTGPDGEDVVRWPSRLAVHESNGSADEPYRYAAGARHQQGESHDQPELY